MWKLKSKKDILYAKNFLLNTWVYHRADYSLEKSIWQNIGKAQFRYKNQNLFYEKIYVYFAITEHLMHTLYIAAKKALDVPNKFN